MDKADKFASLLGFARRARRVIYGYDTLKGAKNVRLYAVSDTASDNLTDGMKKLAKQRAVPLILAKRLEDVAGGNCKALGITDAHMADGILDYIKTEPQNYTNLPVDGGNIL